MPLDMAFAFPQSPKKIERIRPLHWSKPTQGLRYYWSGKPESCGNENLFMQIIPKQNCFGMIVSKSLNDSIYQLSNSLKSLKMFGDANSALKLKQNWHNSSKYISKFTF